MVSSFRNMYTVCTLYARHILQLVWEGEVFEFDGKKNDDNRSKHGISFEDAQKLWADPDLIVGPGESSSEERWVAVGVINKEHWLAVFTQRGSSIRIISCRKARSEEIAVYENSK